MRKNLIYNISQTFYHIWMRHELYDYIQRRVQQSECSRALAKIFVAGIGNFGKHSLCWTRLWWLWNFPKGVEKWGGGWEVREDYNTGVRPVLATNVDKMTSQCTGKKRCSVRTGRTPVQHRWLNLYLMARFYYVYTKGLIQLLITWHFSCCVLLTKSNKL